MLHVDACRDHLSLTSSVFCMQYEYAPYFSSTTNLVKFIKDVSEGRRVGTLVVFMDDGIDADTPLLAIPINLAATVRLQADEAFVVSHMGVYSKNATISDNS